MGNITKTRQPDGSWKQDAQPVRRQPDPKPAPQHPEIAKVLTQRECLIQCLRDIDHMTNVKDVHARIANLRSGWLDL